MSNLFYSTLRDDANDDVELTNMICRNRLVGSAGRVEWQEKSRKLDRKLSSSGSFKDEKDYHYFYSLQSPAWSITRTGNRHGWIGKKKWDYEHREGADFLPHYLTVGLLSPITVTVKDQRTVAGVDEVAPTKCVPPTATVMPDSKMELPSLHTEVVTPANKEKKEITPPVRGLHVARSCYGRTFQPDPIVIDDDSTEAGPPVLEIAFARDVSYNFGGNAAACVKIGNPVGKKKMRHLERGIRVHRMKTRGNRRQALKLARRVGFYLNTVVVI
jgi:hypothetical protein